MNLQKFTVKAQEAVQNAAAVAASKQHQHLEPPHLMRAFLDDAQGIVTTILQKPLVGMAIRSINMPELTPAGSDLAEDDSSDAEATGAEAVSDDGTPSPVAAGGSG